MYVTKRPRDEKYGGYRRNNGKYEGRFRPRTKQKLTEDGIIEKHFRGKDAKGYFKYEFLKYFDTAKDKIAWVNHTRQDFERRKLAESKKIDLDLSNSNSISYSSSLPDDDVAVITTTIEDPTSNNKKEEKFHSSNNPSTSSKNDDDGEFPRLLSSAATTTQELLGCNFTTDEVHYDTTKEIVTKLRETNNNKEDYFGLEGKEGGMTKGTTTEDHIITGPSLQPMKAIDDDELVPLMNHDLVNNDEAFDNNNDPVEDNVTWAQESNNKSIVSFLQNSYGGGIPSTTSFKGSAQGEEVSVESTMRPPLPKDIFDGDGQLVLFCGCCNKVCFLMDERHSLCVEKAKQNN